VATGRATIIDVGAPFETAAEARAWLRAAGEEELQSAVAVLNRGLHAFRVVTADPHVHEVAREQALVARLGYGAGEQVADGHWSEANELLLVKRRQRRVVSLAPQAHMAAVLSGREQALACQELTLRARYDLDHGRSREAAMQVLVALDTALAELARDEAAATLAERLEELRGQRDAIARAAQRALAGPLDDASREAVEHTLRRVEAALRARAVTLA
jgi:hypothetical protein